MPNRVWLWAALLLAAPFALYALHRLCLWLKAPAATSTTGTRSPPAAAATSWPVQRP